MLYFAAASSYTRKDSDIFTAPLPLSRLFGVLEERYPGIRQQVLRSCAVTVNLEYVEVEVDDNDDDGGGGGDDHRQEDRCAEEIKELVIQAGDEVAIIPPVSSG